jgi:hypothetical protein
MKNLSLGWGSFFREKSVNSTEVQEWRGCGTIGKATEHLLGDSECTKETTLCE